MLHQVRRLLHHVRILWQQRGSSPLLLRQDVLETADGPFLQQVELKGGPGGLHLLMEALSVRKPPRMVKLLA